MRPIRILGLSALLGLATLSAAAFADDPHYSVAAGKGQVTVTPAKGWHINKDYSWAIKQGDTKVKAKDDFTLADTATVSGVPAGSYTLKGAVCSDSNCAPFTTTVNVQ